MQPPLDRKGYGEHQGRRQAEQALPRIKHYPENCDRCGEQLPTHIARTGATLHPRCKEAQNELP